MDHYGILSASGLCQRHTARVALRTLCERSLENAPIFVAVTLVGSVIKTVIKSM
jgi:hypothetical protein